MTDFKLSPAAQTVRRNMAQIMHELLQRCRVSISATDTLPITLETNDASLQAGINSLCAAAIRELKDQVAPHRPIPQCFAEWGEYNMTEIIRERLDAIVTELENAQ